MNKARDGVFRGGSWLFDVAAYLAARARFRYAPSYRYYRLLGFRCVARVQGSARALRGGTPSRLSTGTRSVGYRDGQHADVGEACLTFRCARREG